MIVFADKGFQTFSLAPDTDWTGEALYVIPDGSALAQKIQTLYPYYDFVTDDDGALVDVIETERPPEPEPEPDANELLDILLGVSEWE